jgi:DNA-binding CsgD family transcriptional regulator
MSIENDNSMHTIRSWQCVDQIDHLKSTFLSHRYIRGFEHDISYGKGRFSILANDRDYLRYHYGNRSPAVFTDESGRFLPEGVFFTHTLPLKDQEKGLLKAITNTFGFDYIMHIVKHERDLQHMYSFFLRCNENQLLFFIANQLTHLQRFIAIYERQCKQALEFVKSDKDRLILPYSEGKLGDISDVLQSCLVGEGKPPVDELFIPHALDNRLVKLTLQQANCFQLLLQGLTAKDIAQRMNLSYRTIQHYTAYIYERLGLENSRELISHYAYLIK